MISGARVLYFDFGPDLKMYKEVMNTKKRAKNTNKTKSLLPLGRV